MSADLLRLPVRRALRLVADNTNSASPPRATIDHKQVELTALALNLCDATGHFGFTSPGHAQFEDGIAAGSDALEAALFHALTLKGCLNDDLELRRILAKRFDRREADDAD